MSSELPRRLAIGATGAGVAAGVIAFNALVVRTGPPPAAQAILVSLFALAGVTALGAGWRQSRRYLEPVAVMIATASIALSLTHFSGDTPREAMWLFAEMAALLVLLILVVRLSPAPWAAVTAVLLAAAQLLMLLRVATRVTFNAGAASMWASGAVIAAGLGLYLRHLDRQRARSVAAARRAQRLELARDLHDFVAHDVTGMVIQAQAAQVVAERDPATALSALRRVEEAGLHALGSLDRTVRMLGELAPPSDARARAASLEDIAELASRFSANDGTPVALALDPELEEMLPPPVADTVYRIVLESLTNVRRHAASADRIEVRVARRDEPRGSSVLVQVRDRSYAGRMGLKWGTGSGLIALRERVESIGGTFDAGPAPEGEAPGWVVSATIPLPASEGAP